MARLALCLGMKVITVSSKPADKLPEGIDKVTMEQLLSQSDVISLHCPLVKDGPKATYHLINAETLRMMKSEAILINTGRVRKLLNDNGVFWQMAELGKTDAGGGGTVAKYMAKRNIDTLDAGVPVLSMHAPYETVAKLDCYMTYKGMKVFFEQN